VLIWYDFGIMHQEKSGNPASAFFSLRVMNDEARCHEKVIKRRKSTTNGQCYKRTLHSSTVLQRADQLGNFCLETPIYVIDDGAMFILFIQ
jgi:hypothetical protein